MNDFLKPTYDQYKRSLRVVAEQVLQLKEKTVYVIFHRASRDNRIATFGLTADNKAVIGCNLDEVAEAGQKKVLISFALQHELTHFINSIIFTDMEMVAKQRLANRLSQLSAYLNKLYND